MEELERMRRELRERFERIKKERGKDSRFDPNPQGELHFKSVEEMLEKGYVPADNR